MQETTDRLAWILALAADFAPEVVVAWLTEYVHAFRCDAGRALRLISLPQAAALLRVKAAAVYATRLRHAPAATLATELDPWPEGVPRDPDLAYPLPVVAALGSEIGRRQAERVAEVLDVLARSLGFAACPRSN